MGVLDGCHKIDRSSDPNGRLNEVGVNLPVALRIVHSIASENPYWLEKLLHYAYA